MAIAPQRKNLLSIIRNFRSRLESRTGITSFGSDSKTRVLMDVFADQNLASHNEGISAFSAIQIGSARGKQLEIIGEGLGRPIFKESFPFSTIAEQNFAFYVDSGTIGDINLGADITIPAGAHVWSERDENEAGAVITYEVRETVTIPASAVIGYVPVKAINSGAASNVGEGIIRYHNVSSYADSGAQSLKVINLFSVLNGRDRERQESYRFRLAKHYDRLISTNEAKTLLSAISVPGVLDVRTVSGYFGIGTVGVAVLGADYQANQNLVDAVQNRLNQIYGPGSTAIAIPAIAVSFDLELSLKAIRALNVTERRQIEVQIRQTCINYFRGLTIGDTVFFSELSDAIQRSTNGLVRLRKAQDNSKIFTNIYIRRGFSTGTSSERARSVSSVYTLDTTEFADLGTLNIAFV